MKEELKLQTNDIFKKAFQREPEFMCLSPGRINILGEHVDYNHGFVLPGAIDKYVCLAISRSDASESRIVAGDLPDEISFRLDHVVPSNKAWANYFLGVVAQLKARSITIGNVDIAFTSNIPVGAGLSSSAALECAMCFALDHLFGLNLSREDMAILSQKAEHTFVGVQCGIMDQFATLFGKEHHVIKLDCDTLDYEYLSMPLDSHRLVLLDSQVKHELQDSDYNRRRLEVESGLAAIRSKFPGVRTFRDCTEEQVLAVREEVGETIFRRCLYVVYEMLRVRDAADAIQRGDIRKLGELMYETHDGLSNEYDVSCDETDFLVNAVRQDSRVAGARMMGGGFGGCTLNIIESGHEEDVILQVGDAYSRQFGISLKAYLVHLSDGTSIDRP